MKVQKKEAKSKGKYWNERYDYYFALDWSMQSAALARMRWKSTRIRVQELAADVRVIRDYVSKFGGRRILCIEETTGTQWLYVELRDYFDRIVVCDPYRNRLLSDGPKTDKIDAMKLCQLLQMGSLKEVYHSIDSVYEIRKVVSAYEAWNKFGVRFQNQRSALYRSQGLNHKRDKLNGQNRYLEIIERGQNEAIALYREKKQEYLGFFKQLTKENPDLRHLRGISGINYVFAVTILGTVVDASRFATKYQYWAYCGLVRYERMSGGRRYGKRSPRYSRKLKHVYKSAAMSAVGGKNDIREYYEYLLSQGLPAEKALNTVARYIATSTYAMLKHHVAYNPYQWRKSHRREETEEEK